MYLPRYELSANESMRQSVYETFDTINYQRLMYEVFTLNYFKILEDYRLQYHIYYHQFSKNWTYTIFKVNGTYIIFEKMRHSGK